MKISKEKLNELLREALGVKDKKGLEELIHNTLYGHPNDCVDKFAYEALMRIEYDKAKKRKLH